MLVLKRGLYTIAILLLTVDVYRIDATVAEEVECQVDGTCTSVSGSKPTSLIETDGSNDSNEDSCTLYVAESSIPNAGLGVYTGKKITSGGRIFVGDMAIQVEDPDVNAHLRRWFHKNYDTVDSVGIIQSYFWTSTNTLGDFEAEQVRSLVPGVGMLTNAHTGLNNLQMQLSQQTYDLHRYRDPGAGAVTTYHDSHYIASRPIPTGSELLLNYGDGWFESRSSLGMIPLSTDYELADQLTQTFWNITEVKENDVLATKVLDIMLKIASKKPRLHAAIPKNVEELEFASKDGVASLSLPNRIRSTEWLETHGRCLDNMKPGISTIHQGGRGAFATRPLRKGQIVTTMPLIQLRRNRMDIYRSLNAVDQKSNIWYEGKQILLNYVYGNSQSSLLFFPCSPVVNYVNHGNASVANVELRWSSLQPNRNEELFSKSAEEVAEDEHAGLIMELVATQDIRAGDEIFLNYGSEWERAWNDYIQQWKPNDKYKLYISAAELNARNEDVLTRDELKNVDNSPDNQRDYTTVSTVCFAPTVEVNTEDIEEENPNVLRFSFVDHEYTSPVDRYPCDILQRFISTGGAQSKSYYTVRLHYEGEQYVVENVPRSAIRFVDNKYTSDITLRDAFRHEINLPDHMVPDTWHDL